MEWQEVEEAWRCADLRLFDQMLFFAGGPAADFSAVDLQQLSVAFVFGFLLSSFIALAELTVAHLQCLCFADMIVTSTSLVRYMDFG